MVMTATHPAYSPEFLIRHLNTQSGTQEECGYPRSPWEWAVVPSLGTNYLWSPPCKSPQILLLAQDTLGALALPGTGIKTNKAHAIHAPQPAPHPLLFRPGCPRQVLRSLVLSSAQLQPPERPEAGEIRGAAPGKIGPKGQTGAGV